MTKNVFDWNKTDWINKAQESEAGFVGCFIPTITLSFIHDMPTKRDLYGSFKKYTDSESTREVKDHMESLGFSVLYATEAVVEAINHVALTVDTSVSIEQEFLDKKRNVFFIHISDSTYYHKDLILVCEYIDLAHPLADYTVDYNDVAERNNMRESTRALFDKLRKKRENEDLNDLDDLF